MKIVSYPTAGCRVAGIPPSAPFSAIGPTADSFSRTAMQPRFGMWAPTGFLADWLDMVTLSGGVDMTLNYTGQAIARNFAIKVRALPPEERQEMVRHMIRRRGMIKVWTATTVMDLIAENLSGESKLEATKDAVRWYYHYGNNYNYFLALKMADRLQDNHEFRQFMKDFYEDIIEPTPIADEKSLPMKLLTDRMGLLGGYSVVEWAWAYPLLEAGEWLFDKTLGINDADTRQEAVAEALDELPRTLRKAAKNNTPLDAEQLEELREHLKKQLTIPIDDDIDYPEEIDAKAKAVFRQWVEEHPVGAPSKEDLMYRTMERRFLAKLSSDGDPAFKERVWNLMKDQALRDPDFLSALAEKLRTQADSPVSGKSRRKGPDRSLVSSAS